MRLRILAGILLLWSLLLLSGGCSEDGHQPRTFVAGLQDDFAPPSDPTFQTAAFREFLENVWVPHGQGLHDFDDDGADEACGFSFVGLRPNISRATLEISLRASENSAYGNDSVRLEYTGERHAKHLVQLAKEEDLR